MNYDPGFLLAAGSIFANICISVGVQLAGNRSRDEKVKDHSSQISALALSNQASAVSAAVQQQAILALQEQSKIWLDTRDQGQQTIGRLGKLEERVKDLGEWKHDVVSEALTQHRGDILELATRVTALERGK